MKKNIVLTCFLILFAVVLPRPVLAARGTPDTPYFGYGLRMDVNSAQIEESLQWAAENHLDWVALDLDWKAVWPAPMRWDGNAPFGRAARLADTLGLSLVFSITNPPDWAMTPDGPNPELTAILVYRLKHIYPNLQAVELYPLANTRAGWGATPNAAHYANVLQMTHDLLEHRGVHLHLLAGGLSNHLTSPEDRLDVLYLQELYDAGARPEIVSLRLENLSGKPADEPEHANSLRHFERIRQVMVANGQSRALIWVTGFTMPAELSTAAPEEQSEWLVDAYLLMRSRLYFGSSFYACADTLSMRTQTCLLKQDDFNHPFLMRLQVLIREN